MTAISKDTVSYRRPAPSVLRPNAAPRPFGETQNEHAYANEEAPCPADNQQSILIVEFPEIDEPCSCRNTVTMKLKKVKPRPLSQSSRREG